MRKKMISMPRSKSQNLASHVMLFNNIGQLHASVRAYFVQVNLKLAPNDLNVPICLDAVCAAFDTFLDAFGREHGRISFAGEGEI